MVATSLVQLTEISEVLLYCKGVGCKLRVQAVQCTILYVCRSTTIILIDTRARLTLSGTTQSTCFVNTVVAFVRHRNVVFEQLYIYDEEESAKG